MREGRSLIRQRLIPNAVNSFAVTLCLVKVNTAPLVLIGPGPFPGRPRPMSRATTPPRDLAVSPSPGILFGELVGHC